MRIHLPDYALKALRRLEDRGHEAFIVGGCLRDSLLGRKALDFDLATSALPEETRAAFSDYPTIDTGVRHGTLTVLIDRRPLEITTYRTEGTYTDARHPDAVTFVRSIREDLARRDFTCNAMAYHPDTGLYDPFLGQEDLVKKLLRAVGEPRERFSEDALRMLRGLRFAGQLGFEIEPLTLSAMKSLRDRLNLVSSERIAKELNLLLPGDFAGQAIKTAPEILLSVLPELAENGPWMRGLDLFPRLKKDLPLRWAALFLEPGADAARKALLRLRQPRALCEETALLLANVNQEISEGSLRLMISRLGYQTAGLLLELQRAVFLSKGQSAQASATRLLEKELTRLKSKGVDLSLKGLSVTGKDLLRLGYPAGERLGQALASLLELTLTGQAPNRREELLKKAALWLENDDESQAVFQPGRSGRGASGR